VTLTGPPTGSVYPVNSLVTFSGTFTDIGGGANTATWSFDDLSQSGTVNEATGAVSANYTFTTAGVYKVTLTVADGCGGTGIADTIDGLTALVVIYDPDGGFVTGGGWINSPLGAYVADPTLTGKANFGFVSKYQRGATVPTGNTEFHFKAGNLKFQSTSYEWMVVAGARAQFKGEGTINGGGSFKFMLTAIDGQVGGGGGTDKFRIRIWDRDGGGLVYDNQMGADDNGDPTTALGGGSIVIHR
jgi:PKD repeat protein